MIDLVLQDLISRSKKIINPLDRDIHLWRIISTLRGPDASDVQPVFMKDENKLDGNLKWLTTARIRGVVFGRLELNNKLMKLILNVNTQPLDVTLRERRDALLNEYSFHFREHIYAAYSSIHALYDYDLEKEEESKLLTDKPL